MKTEPHFSNRPLPECEAAFNIRLSDSQRVAMALACQRDDLLLAQPAKLVGGAASSFAAALLRRGFATRLPYAPNKPFWDCGRGPNDSLESEHRFMLALTVKGLAAIGVTDADVTSPEISPQSEAALIPQSALPKRNQRFRGKNVQALIALLSRPQGASIDEIVAATGWLRHTARAAITGLRHAGYEISRTKGQRQSASIYGIVAKPASTEPSTVVATGPSRAAFAKSAPTAGERHDN